MKTAAADWDSYRNHSVGFVFQSYNLIPHQTVLSNVELALTLSGVSKSERRERAKKALDWIGGMSRDGACVASLCSHDPDVAPQTIEF